MVASIAIMDEGDKGYEDVSSSQGQEVSSEMKVRAQIAAMEEAGGIEKRRVGAGGEKQGRRGERRARPMERAVGKAT